MLGTFLATPADVPMGVVDFLDEGSRVEAFSSSRNFLPPSTGWYSHVATERRGEGVR
jgi:hypothetical protein